METQRPKSTQTRQPASEQPATFNIQHAAGATITESNDEKMMKTSKVAKHEMATKIIFSQALGVCAELRTWSADGMWIWMWMWMWTWMWGYMVRISAERPKNIRNYVFFINSEMWSLGQGEELTPSPVQLSPSPLGGSTRTVHTRTLYIILTHAAFWAFRFSAFQSFFCSSSLCFPHFFFFWHCNISLLASRLNNFI